MKTVADMVAEWLREHGYDGLTDGEYSGGAGSIACVPGHKVMRGSEWDIVPEEATDES